MGFLHEHIILPFSDLLKDESVHKYLQRLREAESWSDEQMNDFQKQRLHKLLVYAANEVPFYREWIQSHDLNPGSISLNQLPIVNKGIIRREGIVRFSAEHFPVKNRITARSSGSTGEPFTFYETKLSYSVNMAAKLRTWYQAGYQLGDQYMKLANGKRASKIKKIQDRLNCCAFVPFYSITEENLVSILQKIEKDKPLFIRSYPAPLYLLAKYRNSHDGYRHCPKHLFTTGSTLPEAYRNEIERAFGCDIIDSYSCEGTPNTYETVAHNGYTVCGYYGIIEVLDNNNQPVTDGVGRVISTDLWNLAHPFIRYDTQDLVEMESGRITRIMGRESDVLIPAQGMVYTVHNFSRFFTHDVTGVDAYQIERHLNGSITFRLVVNKQYSPNIEQYITEFWQRKLGTDVNIKLTDAIPLMKNNKHLTIVDETNN